MMQQVATSSSKLAVSSLPIHMSGNQNDGRSPSFGENASKSAFEQAIADSEKSAFVKAKDLNDLRGKFVDEMPQKPGEANNHNDLTKSSSGNDSNIRVSDQRARYEPEENAKNVASKDTDNSQKAIDAKETPSNDALKYSAAEQGPPNDGAGAEQSEESVVTQVTAQIPEEDSAKLDFDYINFVSQIQSLNQEKADRSDKLVDLVNPEQANELNNITLTQEELQIILDAKQTGLDLQASLSEEQQIKLGDVIQKMLNQFHEQEQSANTDAQALAQEDDLNTKLLETLLVSSQPTPLEAAPENIEIDGISPKVSSESELIATAIKQNTERLSEPVEPPLDNEQSSSLDADEQSALTAETNNKATQENANKALLDKDFLAENKPALLEPDPNSDEAMLAQQFATNDVGYADVTQQESNKAELRNTLKEAMLASSMPTEAENASLKQVEKTQMPAPVVVNNNDANTTDITKQLALLDERSQTNTLENIKSRVEKFAADLSGNSVKGSEFVAAMQSGLKEFKEQLQSGREPGIDLKALVSDALEQVKVEIPAQNQPKIDSALNQFAGIMNLANNVNQSSQAQAHQLFGLTETQIVKESNVLHAEGTKLAQQSPSNFDKAVNIFKAEGQQQLAEKVRWMVNGRNPAAEIRLDPPELGAMQIKVNMTSETATVSFTVQSAQAKEALDQAVPRLRDMLQEQGIELGQSSVEQQNNGQGQPQEQQSDNSSTGGSASRLAGSAQENEQQATSVIEQRVAGGSLGGIDFYA
jgi:flagellar hook-length control protein FliK